MARVEPFFSSDRIAYPTGTRVVVRTERGRELGEVLAAEPGYSEGSDAGALLRAANDADDLLLKRLEKYRHEACLACERLLAERGSVATLLDAECLFDGGKIYFYFLGDADPIAEQLTAELAATYDSEAQLERFAETLREGCGPGCGTESATGGGCGTSCAGCSAGGCGLAKAKAT